MHSAVGRLARPPLATAKGEVRMKRALMMATVALLMTAMMVAMAMPALAAKPAPTKEECVDTLVAIQHGDKLTGQQQQLPKQFASFSDCIQASSG
jgi:predicted lipoprotein with Yx(FWY)xxD motif